MACASAWSQDAATTQPVDTVASQSAKTATSQPSTEFPQPQPSAEPPVPETARRNFTVRELTLDLGFEAEFRQRKITQDYRAFLPNRYRQTNEYRRFEETIGLRGSGDILSERFARYQFMVQGGLFQESTDENRPGRDLHANPTGEVLQYDAHVTLFPAGKITANLLASQLDDRVPRLFLPSLERRRERYGIELLYNDRVLPQRLSFESTWEELLSPDRHYTDDERRGDKRFEYEATWNISDQHRLRLNYEYDDRSEEYSGTTTKFDMYRHYVTLDDEIQIGDDRRSKLQTIARFQDEAGDIARDLFEIAPQLRLQHDDTFSTHYRGQYLRESFEGVGLDQYRGDIGADKKLGDHFNIGANFHALKQDTENYADVTEWGATGTAGYHQESELGRSSVDLTFNHTNVRGDLDHRAGVVVSEAVTLRDPWPAYLDHTDVRRATIVVSDGNRRRIYVYGRDYTILQVGRYTLLRRIITGRIGNGETVYVSYLYRTADRYELDRDRVDLRVQHEFKNGITPYYSASLQDENADRTRFLGFEPRDVKRHRAGVNIRQPRWAIGGEAELNDDSIDPYKGVHANADATLLDKPPHSLTGRASASFLRFEGANVRSWRDWWDSNGASGFRGTRMGEHEAFLLDFGSTYRLLLSDSVEANLTGTYRYEDDSIFGITNGVDANLGLFWHIGKFTASFELEYDLLDQPRSSDGDVVGWIKLRREIPLISEDRR